MGFEIMNTLGAMVNQIFQQLLRAWKLWQTCPLGEQSSTDYENLELKSKTADNLIKTAFSLYIVTRKQFCFQNYEGQLIRTETI